MNKPKEMKSKKQSKKQPVITILIMIASVCIVLFDAFKWPLVSSEEVIVADDAQGAVNPIESDRKISVHHIKITPESKSYTIPTMINSSAQVDAENDEPAAQLQEHLDSDSMSVKTFNLKKSTIYLKQLQTLSTLVLNFVNYKKYNSELEALDTAGLPTNVSGILEEMKIYSNKYLDVTRNTARIFPKKDTLTERLFGHFVQLDVTPQGSDTENEARRIILAKLPELLEYFNSQQFLDKMLTND